MDQRAINLHGKLYVFRFFFYSSSCLEKALIFLGYVIFQSEHFHGLHVQEQWLPQVFLFCNPSLSSVTLLALDKCEQVTERRDNRYLSVDLALVPLADGGNGDSKMPLAQEHIRNMIYRHFFVLATFPVCIY